MEKDKINIEEMVRSNIFIRIEPLTGARMWKPSTGVLGFCDPEFVTGLKLLDPWRA